MAVILPNSPGAAGPVITPNPTGSSNNNSNSSFPPRGPRPNPPAGPAGGGGGRFGDRNTPNAPPNNSRDEHRINERIRVPSVRLIDEIGTQVGVVSTSDALKMAKERGLDLMEVAPNANPPVCKICDYGKFKYEKKKKEHHARKKQAVIKVKEVQFRPQTEEHDLDYKFKNVREFLMDGDKAKITIVFRGREIAFTENGRKIMDRLIAHVKDIAIIEADPKFEGKRMIMIIGPNPIAIKKLQSLANKAAGAAHDEDHEKDEEEEKKA